MKYLLSITYFSIVLFFSNIFIQASDLSNYIKCSIVNNINSRCLDQIEKWHSNSLFSNFAIQHPKFKDFFFIINTQYRNDPVLQGEIFHAINEGRLVTAFFLNNVYYIGNFEGMQMLGKKLCEQRQK